MRDDDPVLVTPPVKPKTATVSTGASSTDPPRKMTLSEYDAYRKKNKRLAKSRESSRRKQEEKRFLKRRRLEIEGQMTLTQIYGGELESESGNDESQMELLTSPPHPFDLDVPSGTAVRSAERSSFQEYLKRQTDNKKELEYTA